ncbi:S8 family serine peptidase [candidate division KSB1 bacterium]|nr:S8 family serine peptidase [candidate division KSB1 bacterium]
MFKKLRFMSYALLLLSLAAYPQERARFKGLNQAPDLAPSKTIHAPLASGGAMSPKIDPLLRYALVKAPDQTQTLSKARTGLNSLLDLEQNKAGVMLVSVFIKSHNVGATVAQVEASGGYVSTIAADILVARAPLLSVRKLAESHETQSIQASTKSRPLLDASHKEIGSDAVHAGNGLPRGYKGKGVVVGVFDSGIDWKHQDFATSTGESRIQYLWDMSGTSNPPAGYTYGREYTKAQIDAGQCQEIDGNGGGGHGTHVAGIAAGNGRTQTGYTGMAPEADVIFVKGTRDPDSGGSFDESDVVDGCAYIFSKAQAMGKPAVINLSLGGHFGPHDGTSLFEQALSNLTGPGRIIVAAAGNEGADFIHLRYTTGGANPSEARETFWVLEPEASISVAEMWYDSGNISVGLAAYDTSSGNLIGFTLPIAPGQKVDSLAFTVSGKTYGIVWIDATTTSDPNNGARSVFLAIDSNEGQFQIGEVLWSLYTFGAGTFDAWITTGGIFLPFSIPIGNIFPGDTFNTVGSPATAHKVIAVGSYVTKNQWVDIDGVTRLQFGSPTIGQISGFSSVGPSRDNRLKPDLAAPGEAILSALSSDLTIGTGVEREDILSGGSYQKLQGTSMASPHVAGTVALLLERNPVLDYDNVVGILRSTARKDDVTGSSPNNTWGHGKLNALAAVQTVMTGIASDPRSVPANFSLAQNYPNPLSGRLPFNSEATIRYELPVASRVTLTVFDVTGRAVALLASGFEKPGEHSVRWDGRDRQGNHVPSGIYFYRLEATSLSGAVASLTKKLAVLK